MKIKKIIAFLILLLLTGCDLDTTKVRLPNLKGLNRAEMTEKLDRLSINYFFKIKPLAYSDDSQLDQFVEYGSDLAAGNYIEWDYFVYVYTSALPLTTDRLDEVTLPDYQGKSYMNDNIGPVRLARTVDGDTAYFYDDVTNDYIKVRFLGINTPETFSKPDPWGMAASNYTSKRLREASQIVLEGEGNKYDTYDRDLAFIWVDGVLLNLELVQEAFTGTTLSRSSKYFQIFADVENEVMKTGRRYWGEIDPNYRY